MRLFFVLLLLALLTVPTPAWTEMPTLLSDDELEAIEAKGFYFRLDLSLEAFTDSSTAPQVVINTGTPLILPTDGGSSFSGLGSSINLSGSAQSNLNSLINVIGATSVINVGLNIISINSSTNDFISLTNVNVGAQGANFNINVPLIP